jgi:hypothetical protein
MPNRNQFYRRLCTYIGDCPKNEHAYTAQFSHRNKSRNLLSENDRLRAGRQDLGSRNRQRFALRQARPDILIGTGLIPHWSKAAGAWSHYTSIYSPRRSRVLPPRILYTWCWGTQATFSFYRFLSGSSLYTAKCHATLMCIQVHSN